MPTSPSSSLNMEALQELSNLLDTGLSETSLLAILDLLRLGVPPIAIVAAIQTLDGQWPDPSNDGKNKEEEGSAKLEERDG